MTKVYIGNLPLDVKEREIEDLFYKFGKYRYIDIKAQSRPPAFAFIEFEDPRDAAEAVRRRDGIEFAGQKIRVEVAKGGTGFARENFKPPRSTGFRALVKGLPKMASWQDLKDHVRTACKPNYTDVRKDHNGNVVGVVEFDTYEDLKLAISKLDDTEFKNPRYERGHYVRIIEDNEDAPRGREDTRGRSRSRSPRRRDSRSPVGDRDRDHERGRDERPRARDADIEDRPPRAKSDSRSRSRSRSRSY